MKCKISIWCSCSHVTWLSCLHMTSQGDVALLTKTLHSAPHLHPWILFYYYCICYRVGSFLQNKATIIKIESLLQKLQEVQGFCGRSLSHVAYNGVIFSNITKIHITLAKAIQFLWFLLPYEGDCLLYNLYNNHKIICVSARVVQSASFRTVLKFFLSYPVRTRVGLRIGGRLSEVLPLRATHQQTTPWHHDLEANHSRILGSSCSWWMGHLSKSFSKKDVPQWGFYKANLRVNWCAWKDSISNHETIHSEARQASFRVKIKDWSWYDK